MGMLMLETPPLANTSFVWTGCDTAAETRDIETRSTAPLLVGRLPCGGIRSRWRCTQPLCTTPAPRRERLEALRRFTFFAMLRRHYFEHQSFSPYGSARGDRCLSAVKSKPLFHDKDLNRLSKKKKESSPDPPTHDESFVNSSPSCVHGTKAAKARPDLMVLSHQQLLCASLQWRLDAALMRSPSPHPEPRLEQVHQRRPPMGGVDSSFVELSHESFPSPLFSRDRTFSLSAPEWHKQQAASRPHRQRVRRHQTPPKKRRSRKKQDQK